ncbi:MAG: hypothetical protein IPO72_12605 [Saprospiraceae bacterium]|nr:hypothetical protein [Candidatus Vicinibacter affinis]MBK7798240.1 hypothetical protein [Candidatus Vicinibacter affinis]MBK8642669.1 hypothetical protein [Candidatus Vicinibacter affinis]MBK9642081.1 hypothetical protein [Candidatus Vicinibacter affinis]
MDFEIKTSFFQQTYLQIIRLTLPITGKQKFAYYRLKYGIIYLIFGNTALSEHKIRELTFNHSLYKYKIIINQEYLFQPNKYNFANKLIKN